MLRARASLVSILAALILIVGLAATATPIYAYDGEGVATSRGAHGLTDREAEQGLLAAGTPEQDSRQSYDTSSNLARTNARLVEYRLAPRAASGAADAVSQARFAPGRWLTHFEKHGASNCWGGNCLGYANSVDYLRGAQNLTRGGSGVETFVRKSGDTLFYRSSTNEFGVLGPDNILRTYFKPDDGYAYWLQQIGGG